MPSAGIPLLSAGPEFCVVSRRNDSLGSRWRWRVYASLCIVSFGLALGFISPLVVFAIFTLCALIYWFFDDSPRDVG